ncbi:MAG TPA: endolytic transglycosylase MltG [Gallionellaceae bacterium]|nr:endolytic transglycosylase MltG [Gallionellaceae bacterium]
MNVIKELLLWLLFLLVVLAGLFAYYANTPIPLERTPFEFTLKQGSSLKSAASQIKKAGGLSNEWLFVLLARGLGQARQIKPGNYQLEHEVTPLKLLHMISKGRVEQSSLTIIEGTTFRQLRAVLNGDPTLRHDSAPLSDEEILKRIGAGETSAEGLFFPDTYNYDKGSSDLVVLKRAYQLMQRQLQESWKHRDAGLPFDTPYQALILASIVEKETGQPGDRPMIASVFVNRLRKNMRLQTDPTVIYGMGDKFKGNLRRKDLTTDSPYNTYTRSGLTPTPIALPGLAAIQAALHPAPSKALYFVARGDGTSHFSTNLIDHNNAVNRFQLKQK